MIYGNIRGFPGRNNVSTENYGRSLYNFVQFCHSNVNISTGSTPIKSKTY